MLKISKMQCRSMHSVERLYDVLQVVDETALRSASEAGERADSVGLGLEALVLGRIGRALQNLTLIQINE